MVAGFSFMSEFLFATVTFFTQSQVKLFIPLRGESLELYVDLFEMLVLKILVFEKCNYYIFSKFTLTKFETYVY